MGKEMAVLRSPQKKDSPGQKLWGKPVQTSLRGIANRAVKHPEHVFRNLSGLLTQEYLYDCFSQLRKDAATGVDKITHEDYKADLKANIENLWGRVRRGSYKAKFVRRKNIPKGNGKTRPLGIPAIEDKLLQLAVKGIMEAIYEQDFLPCSFGYRPKIGVKDAVKAITQRIHRGKVSYVVEADIRGFFDNIDHEWMVKMLKERIDDRPFIALIQKWLRAGILEEDGKVIHPITGTPQGGIISPVLANIYLHYALDIWFEKVVLKHCKGEAFLVRYADDFICAFQNKDDAERFYKVLGKRLNKFELTLAEEKTKVILFSRFKQKESGRFDFLGFEFYWGKSRNGKVGLRKRTSRKKLQASVANFAQWIKSRRSVKLPVLMRSLNRKLIGYWNYYGVIGNSKSLSHFYWHVERLLFKWLNRRSQRKSFTWPKFTRMLERNHISTPRITEKVNNNPVQLRCMPI